MTEMLKKEFSRKTFVKGGGALIVGFSALGAARLRLRPATRRSPSAGRSDFLPDLSTIDSWLAITADNTVIVTHGEPEFAGTPTGILMLVAEELDMRHGADDLRAAGDVAERDRRRRRQRRHLEPLDADPRGGCVCEAGAAQAWPRRSSACPVASLTVTERRRLGRRQDRHLRRPDRRQELRLHDAARPAHDRALTPGQGIAKPVSQYKIVGTLVPADRHPGKVMRQLHLHPERAASRGCCMPAGVRPRGAGANTSQNHFPISVDEKSIKHIPGAQVVQINNFLAVVAPKEYDAIQAAAQLKVVWKSDPKFGSGSSGNFWSWMRKAGDTNTVNPARYTADTRQRRPQRSRRRRRRCRRPTSTSTTTSCRSARTPRSPTSSNGTRRATVYVQGQSLQGIPPNLATLLGIPAAENIRVICVRGLELVRRRPCRAQAAEQAAIISQKIGKPVRLQWMRWDQHGWDSYGPSAHVRRQDGHRRERQDRRRRLDELRPGRTQRIDTTKELLGTATWRGGSGERRPDAVGHRCTQLVTTNTGYERRVLAKTQPLYEGSFKMQRPPGAERTAVLLRQRADRRRARVRGEDGPDRVPPAEHRRDDHGRRALAVGARRGRRIAAGWKPKVAASNLADRRRRDRPRLRLRHVRVQPGRRRRRHRGEQEDGQDRRQARRTSPRTTGSRSAWSGVANQMSGALIQGLSRALYEQPTCNKERITSLDWVTYPILRFKDTPEGHAGQRPPGQVHDRHPGRRRPVDVSAGNTAAFANGWILTGSGEPPTVGDRRGGRERVLRRHGCPHPPGADEPGDRPSGAEGRRGLRNPTSC